MIDLRYVSTKDMRYTMYCQECEEEFGIPVEVSLDYTDRSLEAIRRRKRLVYRFAHAHGGCGDA